MYNYNINYHCCTCHPESHGVKLEGVSFPLVFFGGLKFRQLKKTSTILQNFAVPSASGGPNDLSTAAIEALNT